MLEDSAPPSRVATEFADKLLPSMAFYVEGLRRGIACYTHQMPVYYLRYVQILAQQKKLGLIISDDTLAHGVNMPFLSVIFLGKIIACNKNRNSYFYFLKKVITSD